MDAWDVAVRVAIIQAEDMKTLRDSRTVTGTECPSMTSEERQEAWELGKVINDLHLQIEHQEQARIDSEKLMAQALKQLAVDIKFLRSDLEVESRARRSLEQALADERSANSGLRQKIASLEGLQTTGQERLEQEIKARQVLQLRLDATEPKLDHQAGKIQNIIDKVDTMDEDLQRRPTSGELEQKTNEIAKHLLKYKAQADGEFQIDWNGNADWSNVERGGRLEEQKRLHEALQAELGASVARVEENAEKLEGRTKRRLAIGIVAVTNGLNKHREATQQHFEKEMTLLQELEKGFVDEAIQDKLQVTQTLAHDDHLALNMTQGKLHQIDSSITELAITARDELHLKLRDLWNNMENDTFPRLKLVEGKLAEEVAARERLTLRLNEES
eukprot:gene8286-9841_t